MSASKQKGTAFETSLLPLLKEWYPNAMRHPLVGAKDVGDFHLGDNEKRFILSAKNHQTMRLAEWVDEAADRLAANFDETGQAVGVVVHKRRGTAVPFDQYATMRLGDFLWLMNRQR